jgi:hypothetical protein
MKKNVYTNDSIHYVPRDELKIEPLRFHLTIQGPRRQAVAMGSFCEQMAIERPRM